MNRGEIVLESLSHRPTLLCPYTFDLETDSGLDVLESVQVEAAGMDPYDLKRSYGRHLSFWGVLGSQSLIPCGTPEEVRGEIRHLVREMGRGGGYVLAGAKALQQGTPVQNADAILEEFVAAGEATPRR